MEKLMQNLSLGINAIIPKDDLPIKEYQVQKHKNLVIGTEKT